MKIVLLTLLALSGLVGCSNQAVHIRQHATAPTLDVCGPPIDSTDVNRAYSTTDVVCPLNTNAVAVASDTDKVWVLSVATPVYFQYCNVDQCGAPFMWSKSPIPVTHSYPVLLAGGIPVGVGTNVLYAIRTTRAFVIEVQSQGMTNPNGTKANYIVNSIAVTSKPAVQLLP